MDDRVQSEEIPRNNTNCVQPKFGGGGGGNKGGSGGAPARRHLRPMGQVKPFLGSDFTDR